MNEFALGVSLAAIAYCVYINVSLKRKIEAIEAALLKLEEEGYYKNPPNNEKGT
jgi:Tfp pilus assembly protein PilE